MTLCFLLPLIQRSHIAVVCHLAKPWCGIALKLGKPVQRKQKRNPLPTSRNSRATMVSNKPYPMPSCDSLLAASHGSVVVQYNYPILVGAPESEEKHSDALRIAALEAITAAALQREEPKHPLTTSLTDHNPIFAVLLHYMHDDRSPVLALAALKRLLRAADEVFARPRRSQASFIGTGMVTPSAIVGGGVGAKSSSPPPPTTTGAVPVGTVIDERPLLRLLDAAVTTLAHQPEMQELALSGMNKWLRVGESEYLRDQEKKAKAAQSGSKERSGFFSSMF